MKKEKLIRAIGEIDGRFIDEAAPPALKKRKAALFIPLVAATLILAILLSATLFILVPLLREDEPIEKYKGNEYYPVIEKLSAYIDKHSDGPIYGGNLGGAVDSPDAAVPEGGLPAPGEPSGDNKDDETSGSPDQGYEEITDNQVDGVIEADIIKRSDRYAYYLFNGTVSAYSIAGSDSAKLDSVTLSADEGYYSNARSWEMYLSADCKTLTVILSASEKVNYRNNYVELIAIDVTKPEEGLTVKNRVKLTGSYLSSRMTDGSFLVMTQYSVNTKDVDFDDPTTFVPTVATDGKVECIPGECILLPGELTNTLYTVAVRLDADTLELEGSGAFLSYSQDVYVSQNSIYAMRNYTNVSTENEVRTQTAMCEIAAMNYSGEELTPVGCVAIEGRIKDQYSLDEHEGILRAVTTTSVSKYKEFTSGGVTGMSWMSNNTNASLYCIDLKTMAVVSAVKNFAPDGESVQSVRFDGDMGYVCTAIRLSDPVYFFNLSDVSNITYKETDPITGYSTSLVNFGDGYLLGIGIGSSWGTFKVEVYEEAADKIVSVDSFELESTDFSTKYKAYYIDRKNGLVGLGVSSWKETATGKGTRYMVLGFDGSEITVIHTEGLLDPNCNYDFMRGFYADGYFYIFAGDAFRVVNIG
ncbi:MAG: beta-propeller domain-containing protein [Clostridia bacterium]|nr:beta-propeller domain-containing protein [Clostridia bacterium]